MKGLFGDNIRETIAVLKPEKKYEVEFPVCGHPELIPTMWGQEKPESARSVGACPLHDYTCPVCGFGVGGVPNCDCPERRY